MMGHLRVKTPRTFMPGDVIMGKLNAPRREEALTVVQSPKIVRDMRMVGVQVRERGTSLVFCSVDTNYVVESER